MNDEQIKDMHIEIEFTNPVYDILDEIITYTMKKYNYKEYDIVKLILKIYDGNYTYISNDNDYRDQFMLLDKYFKSRFGHSVITFEMIKHIINIKDSERYNEIVSEIAQVEEILRTSDDTKKAQDLSIFSYPIANKKYDDLMNIIEKNISMKYAVAIIYDKIKIGELRSN